MVNCGGCGREIELGQIPAGVKFMCSRCYRVQAAGEAPARRMSKRIFLAASLGSLAAILLAGVVLCVVYLQGTGDASWFALLTLLLLGVVACPGIILLRVRNLSLLAAALYIPLGAWSFLWRQAPGVAWLYGSLTGWLSFSFWAIGLGSLMIFLNDLGIKPRL